MYNEIWTFWKVSFSGIMPQHVYRYSVYYFSQVSNSTILEENLNIRNGQMDEV